MNIMENLNASVRVDWTNPPNDTEIVSLWSLLHDSKIFIARSNAFDRTFFFSIKLEHIAEYLNAPKDTTITINFDGVESLRVIKYSVWPGNWQMGSDLTPEEVKAQVECYNRMGREESIDWHSFEQSLNCDPVIISDGDIITKQNAVALRLIVDIDSEYYAAVYIRAYNFSIHRSDNIPINLSSLLEGGKNYWEKI